jgi:hypothetical protein
MSFDYKAPIIEEVEEEEILIIKAIVESKSNMANINQSLS